MVSNEFLEKGEKASLLYHNPPSSHLGPATGIVMGYGIGYD